MKKRNRLSSLSLLVLGPLLLFLNFCGPVQDDEEEKPTLLMVDGEKEQAPRLLIQDRKTQKTSPLCDCQEAEEVDKSFLIAALSHSSPFEGLGAGYDGAPVGYFPQLDLDKFSMEKIYPIVVTGSTPCGHMLVNVGGTGGWYFHIHTWYDYPFVMDEQGYQRYLRENGKREVFRYEIEIPEPEKARKALKSLLRKTWFWLVLPHNCVGFAEAVAQAGGSSFGLYFNCPLKESYKA